jgi:hypothetical protein
MALSNARGPRDANMSAANLRIDAMFGSTSRPRVSGSDLERVLAELAQLQRENTRLRRVETETRRVVDDYVRTGNTTGLGRLRQILDGDI